MEIWRPVVGYEPFYEVSNYGNLRRSTDRTYRKAGTHVRAVRHKQYMVVGLTDGCGKRRQVPVHRLVMAAFVGPLPKGQQVNHINGLKCDNRLENLEYVTPLGNVHHAKSLGLYDKTGSNNGRAVLTERDIPVIRDRLAAGETEKRIAADYGVNQTSINHIRTRRTWSHVA